MNLNVAMAVDVLAYSVPGIQIALTRTSDQTLTNPGRVDYADNLGCNVFVSIHHNGDGHITSGYVLRQVSGTPYAPQERYVLASQRLAECITGGLHDLFHSRVNVDTELPCEVPDFFHLCAPEDSYEVLCGNGRPAIISEAMSVDNVAAPEMCSPVSGLTIPSEGVALEAAGIVAGLKCFDATNTAAAFPIVFASTDSAYALTDGETESAAICLIGWNSSSTEDEPDTLAVYRALANGGGGWYRGALGTADSLKWVEIDSLGRTCASAVFGAGSATESDLALLNTAPGSFDPFAATSPNTVVAPADVPPGTPVYDPVLGRARAHVVVYAVDGAQGALVYDQIRQDVKPEWTVRLIVGDNSVGAFRDSVRHVLMANGYEQFMHPAVGEGAWPVRPGPEVYLVGDMESVIPPTIFDSRFATFGCGHEGCLSDVLLYDVTGPSDVTDGLPDGPFSRIPCSSPEEAQRVSLYAHEYNGQVNVDPSMRFIMGVDPFAPATPIGEIKTLFESCGLNYGGLIVPPITGGVTSAWPEFIAKARVGVSEIFAFGGASDAGFVPGRFLDCDAAMIGKKQRAVFWGPGCGVAGVNKPDAFFPGRCAPPAPLLEHYLFGAEGTTTFAGAVGSIGNGYDEAHLAVGKVLTEERVRAASLGGSLARAVFNTILRISAEQPEYTARALGLAALGSYVDLDLRSKYSFTATGAVSNRSATANPTAISCYNQAVAYGRILGCPAGDATGWSLSVTVGHPGGVDLEALNAARLRVAEGTDASVVLWNGIGQAVQVLAPTAVNLAAKTVTFDVSRLSGCGTLALDFTIGARTKWRVCESQVSSVDHVPSALGLVDLDDQNLYWPGACAGGLCSHVVVAEHAAHMVPRRLIYPVGGETFFWGDVVTIAWEPLGGNDPTVSLTLARVDDPLNALAIATVPATVGHHVFSIPWGTTEGVGYFVSCDYGSSSGSPGFAWSHVSLPFAIRAPVGGDPGGGCPEVAVNSLGAWRLENTILGSSVDEGPSIDACRLRFVDSRDTVIHLRVYENASATTALRSLRLIRVMHGADEVLYASGDSALIGKRVAPMLVTDEEGNDVSAAFGPGGRGLALEAGRAIVAHWGSMDGLLTAVAGDREAVFGEGDDPEIIDDGGGKGSGYGARSPEQTALRQANSGLLVSVPDSSGEWHVAEHVYPRLDPSGWALNLGAPDSIRVSSVDKRWVRFVGRLHRSRVLPQAEKLQNLSATHNHLGDLMATADSLGNISTTIAPGDTVELSYRNGAAIAGLVPDFVLLSAGAYSRTLPGKAQEDKSTPSRFSLSSVRPNPMAGATTFRYEIPIDSDVHIELFDVQGRIIRRISRLGVAPGRYLSEWDGRDHQGRKVPQGIYLYRFAAGKYSSKGRIVVLP